MKYTRVYEFKDVKSFKVHDIYVAYLKKDNTIFVDGEYLSAGSEDYFFLNENFYYTLSTGTKVVNLKSREKKFIKIAIIHKYLDNNSFLVGSDWLQERNNYYSACLSLYQFEPYKKLYDLPYRYTFGINYRKADFLYCVHLNTVKCLFLTIGDYTWKSNLAIARVVEIIGIYAEKLIITYETDSNQTGILGLDIHTGETIWDTLLSGIYNFFPVFNKNGDTVVNLYSGGVWVNGIQIVKGTNIFREIDLNTGEAKREGVLTDLDVVGLNIKTFIVEGDYIYFTANYQGSFGAIAVGILDYENLNLLWWQVVEMQEADGFGNFLMNKPVVGGNKLYVLDKTGVLHVFEQEADVFLPKTSKRGLVPFDYLPPPTLSKPSESNDESLPF